MNRTLFLTIFLALLLVAWGCSKQQPGTSSVSVDTESLGWFNSLGSHPLFGPDSSKYASFEFSEKQKKELVSRGEYLANSAAACGYCHAKAAASKDAEAFAGGQMMRDRFGEVHAANITPDNETGIGSWTVADLMRAVRTSIAPDGTALSIDVHEGYRWMSDEDAKALAIYLQTLEPVSNIVSRRKLSGFERRKMGLFSQHGEIKGYVPSLVRNNGYQYGWYLTQNVAQCGMCHSKVGLLVGSGETLSGKSSEGVFSWSGPDIRGNAPSGLADWTEEDIRAYLSSGSTPSGVKRDGNKCPWPYYSNLSPEDKAAISKYLKRLS